MTSAPVGTAPSVAPAPTSTGATPAPAPSTSATVRGAGCTGTTSDELQQALLQRASDARHCYQGWITNNTPTRVTMNVSTRVFINGDVGKVDVTSTPSVPSINQCVAKEFEKGGFPLPAGNGCVDVHVPIDFTPAQ